MHVSFCYDYYVISSSLSKVVISQKLSIYSHKSIQFIYFFANVWAVRVEISWYVLCMLGILVSRVQRHSAWIAHTCMSCNHTIIFIYTCNDVNITWTPPTFPFKGENHRKESKSCKSHTMNICKMESKFT